MCQRPAEITRKWSNFIIILTQIIGRKEQGDRTNVTFKWPALTKRKKKKERKKKNPTISSLKPAESDNLDGY